MADPATERTLFRSFAERYVVERASTFRVGHEDEDGWKAILHSKTIYKQIHNLADATWLVPGVIQPGSQQLGAQGATGAWPQLSKLVSPPWNSP